MSIFVAHKNAVALHLKSLKLTNFRNYETASLEFSERLNCFVGRNGAGKTNLLDAIYYMCMCKSYFGAPDKVMMQHSSSFFRVDGQFLAPNAERVVAKVQNRKKKVFERNDIRYQKLSEHIGLLPVVMIAPDDTRLATEGSEGRRKFLDNTLSQLDRDYLRHLIQYNKLLDQRNALLKQFSKTETFDGALLSTYDMQMVAPATYIHETRKSFVAKFEPVFQKLYGRISADAESVSCTYSSQLSATNLGDLLAQNLQKDRILQRTTGGIHRDDLDFIINERTLKRYASQGQLKSFVLAVKLAQYDFIRQQKNCEPLLLLDDIFDKLDADRVRQLLGLLLESAFGQIFITDTHENRVASILTDFSDDYRKFLVVEGSISTD